MATAGIVDVANAINTTQATIQGIFAPFQNLAEIVIG